MVIVRDMAIEWWESKRPVGWDLKEHLKHPRVNCSTEAEQNLATAVASDLTTKFTSSSGVTFGWGKVLISPGPFRDRFSELPEKHEQKSDDLHYLLVANPDFHCQLNHGCVL